MRFQKRASFFAGGSEKGLRTQKKRTHTQQLLQLLKTQDPPLAHAMPAQPSSCYYVLVPLA